MNILNKIIIVIFVPIFILAEVLRAPGQPSAKPIKHKKEQRSNSAQDLSQQYVLTVKKSGGKSPEYNINIRPVGTAQNLGLVLNSQPVDLSTHDSEESIERISFGDWRD